jgi:CRP-like cAMP-binding protein
MAIKLPFDVNVFLNTAAVGRSVATYRKNEEVFSQGDPADAVFYIQEGKVKFLSYPSKARRRSSLSLGTETSSAKVV